MSDSDEPPVAIALNGGLIADEPAAAGQASPGGGALLNSSCTRGPVPVTLITGAQARLS